MYEEALFDMFEDDYNLSNHKTEYCDKRDYKRKHFWNLYYELIWHPDRVVNLCYSEDEMKDHEILWSWADSLSRESEISTQKCCWLKVLEL